MGKSTPSAPAAPDPYATASAQGTANANTATAQTMLNNANQNTPYGTVQYAQSGSYEITNPDGSKTTVPTMTMQETLNPAQQKLLNQQESLGFQANNAASLALRTANQSLANPVTADNLPALTTSVGAPTLQNSYASGQLSTGYDGGGAIQTGYNTGPALQNSYDSGGAVTRGYDAGGPIQSSVGYDLSGTDAHQNANSPTSFGQTQNGVQYFQGGDFSGERDAATNAALARLAPSMAAQSESLNSSLANQGTAQGSAAWNAAQLSQNQAN